MMQGSASHSKKNGRRSAAAQQTGARDAKFMLHLEHELGGKNPWNFLD
ncbi:MAG: hypothetical protein JSS32_04350 [Verrucomicrobia bacterium]|nr:hypothetical protein [Verrucomicrobiota bacterium]